MKIYFEPITTAIQLAANERLCDNLVASIGGNEGITSGGEGQGDWNPM